MLSIAHVATGAFIATKITNPWLAIPLILASHYYLDAIAHWDAGTGLSQGHKTPRQAILAEIPDLLASFAILTFFLPQPFKLTIAGLAPYWGGLLALLPDIIEAPKNFLRQEPRFLRPLNRFHHLVHRSVPNKLDGLAPQAILLLYLYLLK